MLKSDVQAGGELPGGRVGPPAVYAGAKAGVVDKIGVIARILRNRGEVGAVDIYIKIADISCFQVEAVTQRDIVQFEKAARFEVLIGILVGVV